MSIHYPYPSRRVIRTRSWISEATRENWLSRSSCRFSHRAGCVTGGVLSPEQVRRLERLLPDPVRRTSLNATLRRRNQRALRDYHEPNDYLYEHPNPFDISEFIDF